MVNHDGVQPILRDLKGLLESLLIPVHCAEVAEVRVGKISEA